MTDLSASLLTPASELSPQSALAPAPEFDVSRVDTNIRAISAVEKSWRLPALPDQVKLDLAVDTTASPDNLFELLTGLDFDLSDLDDQPEREQRIITPEADPFVMSGAEQAQVVLAGLTSRPAPERIDEDAVATFKKRAVSQGYLPEDTEIDSKWSPELNSIRGQMAYDTYNDRMRGDRPGALPFGSAMKLLDDFTSPTGLLAAATDLDLWWDVGAIKREASSWGDKWRELGKSKNPWDFAGNLVDALTGPIDDLVLPVLNMTLLASGVGAAFNTGRIAFMGARALEAGSLFGRIYNSGTAGRMLMGGASLERNVKALSEASMIGGRLARSSNQIAAWTGKTMSAYRANPFVATGKGVVQQGMRLGFTSQAEDRMGMFQGGIDLSDVSPEVDMLRRGLIRANHNPAALPVELLLAPYNVWSPGTFVSNAGEGLGLASDAGSRAFKLLGTAVGRGAAGATVGIGAGVVAGDDAGDIAKGAVAGAVAGAALPAVGKALGNRHVASAVKGAAVGGVAGAFLGDDPTDVLLGAGIGAGLAFVPDTVRERYAAQLGESRINKIIRGVGNAFEHTSFRPVAENQTVALSWDQGMRDRYMRLGDEDALRSWVEDVEREGVVPAMAKRFHGGDEEMASAQIAYVYKASMIDYIASNQAGEGGQAAYFRFRNKLVNQTRRFEEDLTPGNLSDLAQAISWTEGGTIQQVYRRRRDLLKRFEEDPDLALTMMRSHNEKAKETIRQIFSMDNLPKADVEASFGGPESLVLPELGGSDLDTRAGILRQYLPQVEDFVGYSRFSAATSELRLARQEGLFLPAKLKGVKTPFGTTRRVKAARADSVLEGGIPDESGILLATDPVQADKEIRSINRAVTDHLLSGEIDRKALGSLQATPAAEAWAPGRVTVQNLEKPTKQQIEELAEQVKDLRDTHKSLAHAANVQGADWAERLVNRYAKVDPNVDFKQPLSEFRYNQIKAMAAHAANADHGTDSIKRVLDYGRRHGLKLDEITTALTRHADELAADAAKWKSYGLDAVALGDQGRHLAGFEALDMRLKQLNEKAVYTAAEIDVDELVSYYNKTGDTANAERIREMATSAEADGYRLVHGVEYMMPEDLMHGPMFEDITVRHLRAQTLGNFFKGKLPYEAHIVQDRRYRQALSEALSAAGRDVSPESREVDDVLSVFRDFLRRKQGATEATLRDVDRQPIGDRMSTRLKSSFTPMRPEELRAYKDSIIPELRAAGFSEAEALAAWRAASSKFRATEFKDVGLYGLEAKMRNLNVAEWGLKTLTGSKYGEGLSRMRGTATAAAAGAVYGGVQTIGQEDLSFEDKLKAVATGAAVGAGAKAVGAVAGKVGLDRAAEAAANWKYGFLPDQFARARDALRFTLSPWFDISRYTEGLMLAQTSAPFRNAKGERIQLPLNMSPKGLRKRLAKELAAEGAENPVEAARDIYNREIRTFQEHGRRAQDFDPEALDSFGRWFKQVGVMGFSPTDWMGTAFVQLKRQGLTDEAAYQAARDMYTYGTRGRSAAEMSVNFIFFPFSFQKKALGHLGKWMNQDLGRSIMIHDALKTYEMLDEKYDLESRWRDQFPILQQLNKINMFAFGLSPGKGGGMNSQLFEFAGKTAWNAFVPGGLEISDVDKSDEAMKVLKGMVPIWNDINWMGKNLSEQGHVLMSESHVTRGAEVRRGYEAWNDYKRMLGEELQSRGYTFEDMHSKPWLSDVKQMYLEKQAELAEIYPAWTENRAENMQEIFVLNEERKYRVARAQQGLREGTFVGSDDRMTFEFESVVQKYRQRMQLITGTTDLTDAPPEVFDDLLSIAAEYARLNPGFLPIYDRLYAPELGPITVELV